MQRAAQSVTYQLGKEVLTLTICDQYHKLADVVTKPQYRHLIDNTRQASWSRPCMRSLCAQGVMAFS